MRLAAPQAHKGSKELRMLTADMDMQPDLPARRSQNAVATAERPAALEPQPPAARGQGRQSGALSQRRRSHKPAASDSAAALRQTAAVQQPEQPAAEPKQRITRGAAAQAAVDSQQPSVDPAGNSIPPPRRNQRPADRQQSPVKPHPQPQPQPAEGHRPASDQAATPALVEATPVMPTEGLTNLVDRLISAVKPQPGSQVGNMVEFACCASH